MISIKNTEHFCIGHSANDVFHSRMVKCSRGTARLGSLGSMHTLILLFFFFATTCNDKIVEPGSEFRTLFDNSQLFHSLKFLFKWLAKGNRNLTWRVDEMGSIGINLNFMLDTFNLTKAFKDIYILGFCAFFYKALNPPYQV